MPCFIRRSSSSTLGNAGRRALLDDDALRVAPPSPSAPLLTQEAEPLSRSSSDASMGRRRRSGPVSYAEPSLKARLRRSSAGSAARRRPLYLRHPLISFPSTPIRVPRTPIDVRGRLVVVSRPRLLLARPPATSPVFVFFTVSRCAVLTSRPGAPR